MTFIKNSMNFGSPDEFLGIFKLLTEIKMSFKKKITSGPVSARGHCAHLPGICFGNQAKSLNWASASDPAHG
jgi:hypothetical protein